MICACPATEPSRGRVASACWLGAVGEGIAVGYEHGAVAVFAAPAAAHASPPGVANPIAQAEPVTLLAAPRPDLGPVRSLQLVLGLEELGPCMLVRGGQAEGEPDMLSFLPLQRAKGPARLVPWFGNVQAHALVAEPRGPGSAAASAAALRAAAPQALMVLTEGGQLVVHELQTWTPTPLTLPFQELPPVVLARLVDAAKKGAGVASGAHAAQDTSSQTASPHALTLAALRAAARRAGAAAWPFKGGDRGSGGQSRRGALLFTGHRDGRVRLWDATLEAPQLLATTPAGAATQRLRVVTALEVGEVEMRW